MFWKVTCWANLSKRMGNWSKSAGLAWMCRLRVEMEGRELCITIGSSPCVWAKGVW